MSVINSNTITFIDTTDTKKLDVHISSNYPTVQIYNTNDGTYTPNWSATSPLNLTPTVYADSIDVTSLVKEFTWTVLKGTDASGQTTTTSGILQVTSNELSSIGSVRYRCSGTYNGKPFENEITFARVDTGKNGESGSSAPAVQAQYSADGNTGWTTELDSSAHKYIRLSYDNGHTWPSVFKIAGEDGTSVKIKGTATSKTAVAGTSYYTLVYNSATITGASVGDAYLLDGNLYVCVDSRDGNDYFIDVGRIQGPAGAKGDSYYLFIRYSDDINGTNMSSTASGRKYIGFYRSSVNQAPTDSSFSTWNWSKFVGDDAKSIVLTGSAQVFKVNKSNVILPGNITITAQAENTSVHSWSYSTMGSPTFLNTLPEWITVDENTAVINGAKMTSDIVTIKASDSSNIYSDVFTVYKVFDGTDGAKGDDGEPAPTVFLTNENITFAANANGQVAGTTVYCNVVAYSGTDKVVPTIGEFITSELPNGMSIGEITTEDNELKIPIIIDNDATLGSEQSAHGTIHIYVASPGEATLQLTWSKINSGATGAGINSVKVSYGVTTATPPTQPTSWQTNIPTVAEGAYLWTKTETDYTDDAIKDTTVYTYVKQGTKGDAGTNGSSVTVSYVQYQAGTSATTVPTGTWYNNIVAAEDGHYLWTKTTFSDGKVAYGVAKQGTDGAKGDQGIPAVTFQVYAPNGYLLTKDIESLALQAFAYEGSAAITSGATYQWSQLADNIWTTITGATSETYTVTKADVLKSKSYRCVMTYKGQTYTSTATVQDKTDTYNSIMCISSNATNNDCYWVLYTLVYSDTEEVDPLLGPISTIAPSSAASGDYWYSVDATNATVTLKKYNGTSWANSTDKQALSYYWDLINDGSTNVPLGESSKVKVVSCADFTATATLVCEVSNVEDGLLTQSSLSITDASDPIVSETEPTATVNGQIWIKPNNNGTYLMFVWDASLNNWISSDMDTRNKVYTSRPSTYAAGDLWITASDTDHGTYLHGTLLQAQKSNTSYVDTDWSPTLRYDQDINDMKETLNSLSQYVTITSAGLRIGARNASGELSPFTSLFTSTELSFYQNSEKLLTLANNKLTAPRIEVEDDLVVQGSISLGNLKLIIESNGSFSFAVQK